MSYDISLVDPVLGSPVEVIPHEEGGTYALGGSNQAELNVTYNYSICYSLVGFSLKAIDGLTGDKAALLLGEAVSRLGITQYEDYWAPTPGNAGYAAGILLSWANQHPRAIFEVT